MRLRRRLIVNTPFQKNQRNIAMVEDAHTQEARQWMVREQLRARGIRDARVLRAMEQVPRHLFVPSQERDAAYADNPLPIGHGQTISQPQMVATMLESLELTGNERVLDVGAGSGYQTALLAQLTSEVYAIEIIPELAEMARRNLAEAGIRNVEVIQGDGREGWPEAAPYDGIVVAAGAPEVPQALLDQLAEGGRMLIPVGEQFGQVLTRIRKRGGRYTRERLTLCAFVPLVEGRRYGRPAD
jgi:protein-L-isoaspartate(D-aspartate) O-methyltransferase